MFEQEMELERQRLHVLNDVLDRIFGIVNRKEQADGDDKMLRQISDNEGN